MAIPKYSQLLTALLLTDDTLNTLYSLKLKAKPLSNTLYDNILAYTLLTQQCDSQTIFITAQQNCSKQIITNALTFQTDILTVFLRCRSALQKAHSFLLNNKQIHLTTKKTFLLSTVVDVGMVICQQYINHINSIEEQWGSHSVCWTSFITYEYCKQYLDQMNILLLHIDYETYVSNSTIQHFKEALIELKNWYE